jgi:hypothetical protein
MLHEQLTELNKVIPQNGIRLPLALTASSDDDSSGSATAGTGSSDKKKKGEVDHAETSRVSRFVVEKCKIMSSKKAPLWLVFETDNGDEKIVGEKKNDSKKEKKKMSQKIHKTTTVLFKDGDDLRQDQLTIAVMRVVERCWSRAGLDLKMLPYGCVSKLFCAACVKIEMFKILQQLNQIIFIYFFFE